MGGCRPRRLLGALVPLAVALTLGLSACSPESNRGGRGGSGGADVGNRSTDVQLQGDEPPEERIYFETPLKPPTDDR